ncbi:MAG: hypothetical protein HUU02_01970 [Bacteroidetes bacterium]|nr:hypothetical protein [Bacteroidota bacterium]
MKIALLALLLLLPAKDTKEKNKEDYTFRLEMHNGLPVMFVQTSKAFGCSNYGIYLRQGWSRDTLTVNILGVDSRVNCDGVPERARGTLEIRGMRERQFILRILTEKKANLFSVETDEDDVTVTPILFDFIRAVTN